MSNNISEKFSADKSELGFEYQFYFFLWKLLEMKTGETVSWEVKDDVSLDLSDGTSFLFQLKHTAQHNSDKNPINMTDLDSDLWKTLSNWSQIIYSKGESSKQIAFLQKTFFVLATNKSEAKKSILTRFEEYINGKINFSVLKQEVVNLQKRTENETIKKYISNCLELDDKPLKHFFKNLQFQMGENDLIQKCKDSIKVKMIPNDKIDKVYDSLYSNIRNDNYITIKKGNSISISFEDFHKKYRRCFDKYRSGELIVVDKTNLKLPDNIKDQLFIKQLVDIGDIEKDDSDSQIEFTRFRIQLERSLDEWCQLGDITGAERDDFLEEGITLWKNEFRSKYRGLVDSSLYNEKGLQIIDELRNKTLRIKGQDLSSEVSNGTFYYLADIPKIGFVKDWKDRYEE